ncbi:MAG TPA: alpha-amylase family glycosyl hydrolase, partial [Candidatus Baltobacteraceae bacterium]|nr:alpha-amylase family glycosyl hydrolase [Candidatus Baltobacteraceae bacterium]
MPDAWTIRPKVPRATYRLQFHEHFRLCDALTLVPYFAALGISHIYASPLFKARAHSVHGYDVCDYGQLNPEIGTEAELENFVNALHKRGIGLVVDIVPNHMGIGTQENSWWWDVLKNGRASQFANHFDINWEPSDPKLCGKILVPILGNTLENVFNKSELNLRTEDGEFFLEYYEHEFPVALKLIPKDFSIRNLLEQQHYVLAPFWEGDEKLNYRRFFAVSTLAGIRVEDEKVFDEVHALLRKWIERGWIDGLRVDHPDGLREPKKYLERLRSLAPDLWIIVEKILQPKEDVPDDWPVQGTVGYDFLNQVNGLFIESNNKGALINFYSEFTGEPTDVGKAVREKKIIVLKTLFTTEVNRLVEMLAQIAAKHSAYQKFSSEQWREALIEFAASFPVYRAYVRPE